MDAATIRAMLEQHFENAGSDPELAHAMYIRHRSLGATAVAGSMEGRALATRVGPQPQDAG
jgi:hypothetical protein